MGCGIEPRKIRHCRGRGFSFARSSWEADEQSGAAPCRAICGGANRSGAGGANGGDQGECGPAKHAPDAEPGKRVTGAGTHTEGLCRHTPKVGAVCGKAARTVLCGGRAMKPKDEDFIRFYRDAVIASHD